MNPLTNVKNITKLNETELATGLIHKKSWHDMYKDSAWIFIGGLEYGLTEGDVLAVFSQYGEIENINLVRDKKTGKSKGYGFLCYSNQKSTVLAVDNFNGIKLCNRTIRVDHVANYKPPKENERDDEVTKLLKSEGCAPRVAQKLVNKEEVPESKNDNASESKAKKKKTKKEKKEKKKKKRKHKSDYNDSNKEMQATEEMKVKKEKHDPGYDKYDTVSRKNHDANRKRRHEERTNCSDSEYYSTKYIKTEKNDDLSKHKLKIKTEPGLEREYVTTNKNNVPDRDREKMKSRTESRSRNYSDKQLTSSRRQKRKKSSSSSSDDDCQTDDNRRNYRLKDDTRVSKRNFEPQKKSARAKDSSSSSSDDASSTESSSEDEKHGDRYSNKDAYKTVYKNRPNQEDRNYYRTGDSYSASSRDKHYDKLEKHDEHKSRTKYKASDRDESYSKDSYYQKKKSHK